MYPETNKIGKVINLEKLTRVSSGSSAGGGGSNLPTRKCSIPVQAIITPAKKEQDVSLHTRASWCTLKQFQVNGSQGALAQMALP